MKNDRNEPLIQCFLLKMHPPKRFLEVFAIRANALCMFLLVVSAYVLCITLIQINWSTTVYMLETDQCDESSTESVCINQQEELLTENRDNDHVDLKTEHRIYDAISGVTRFLSSLLPKLLDFKRDDSTDDDDVIPDGFDTCYLYNKLEKPGLPVVHSVFADGIAQRVVITGVLRKAYEWHERDFVCDFRREYNFENGNFTLMTLSDPIVQDFRRFGDEAQYSVVITCPIPRVLHNRTNFQLDFRLGSNPDLAYENITVCQAATNKSPKYFLTMCTMTKDMDRYIPHWLTYHEKMGVEHVYIYDNARKSIMARTAARHYVKTGFLTIIPWSHKHSVNKTYLEVQVASENDCMWRFKHTSQWMIKIDVDEFLQPLDPNRPTIPDYIKHPNLDFNQLGSVRIQNWFFCRHTEINYGLKSLLSIRSVFERNLIRHAEPVPVNRGRDKAIARPANVHLYKIHGVKLGGNTMTLSPYSEMRMVHYRGDNPRHPGFCLGKQYADFSMIRLWYRLNDGNMTELEMHLGKMLTLMKRLGVKDANSEGNSTTPLWNTTVSTQVH